MKTIRVGIVGLGGAGLAHVGYFQTIPDVEVVALMDPDHEAIAARLASQGLPQIPATNRIEQILNDPRIDLVSICTPDPTHADYAVAAFEAGKHVVVEKPLASSAEQCARMIAAWKRSGKVGAVQHQFRFEPWFQRAAEIARSGRIGEVFSIRGEYVHNLIRRSRRYHPWRFEGPDAHPPMIGAGVHFFDFFRYATGSEISTIRSIGNHVAFPEFPDPDCIEANFTFVSGAVGGLTVAIGVDHPIRFPFRIFGTRGTLIDGWLVTEETAEWVAPDVDQPMQPPFLQRAKRTAKDICRAILRPRRTLERAWSPARRQTARYHRAAGPYAHQTACIRSLANVISAVRDGTQPTVTIEEGARSCQVAFAATQSYRENRVVEVGGGSRAETVTVESAA